MFTNDTNKKVSDSVDVNLDLAVSHFLDAYLITIDETYPNDDAEPDENVMRDKYFEVLMLFTKKLSEEIDNRMKDQ